MAFIEEFAAEKIGLDWILAELRPLSPYGKREKSRLKARGPGGENWLRAEWSLVAGLLTAEQNLLARVEHDLAGLRDIRGAVDRACRGYVLEDVEFYQLKRFLATVFRLQEKLALLPSLSPRLVPPVADALFSALTPGGVGDGFYLSPDFSPLLGELREKKRRDKARLARWRKERQDQVSALTGKSFNSLGRLRLAKLDPAAQALAGRPDLVLLAEDWTELEYGLRDDQEAQALARAIEALEEEQAAEEGRIRALLSKMTAANRRLLLAACRRLGRVDLLLAKGRLAQKTGWCVPRLVPGPKLALAEFVNPPVASGLAAKGLIFQPLSLHLSSGVTVITGANMGGKSVALRSAGLAVAMAQYGLLVPAKSCCFSLCHFIFYSQRAEDSQGGLSAFATEISGLAQALPRRAERGLYLLDEPARGTNPWEGAALVKALARWLKVGESITLLVTHYPGLSDLAGANHLRVAGLGPARGGTPLDLHALYKLMDYSLLPGKGEVPRDAIRIARHLGLPPEITAGAAKELGIGPQEVLD